jgi:hypothetical protein
MSEKEKPYIGLDIISVAERIQAAIKQLDEGPEVILEADIETAEKEMKYEIAVMQETARLSKSNWPATLTGQMVKGSTAKLKYDHAVAAAKAKALLRAHTSAEKQLSALQTLFNRLD